MNINMKYLFAGLLVIVAGSVYLVSRDGGEVGLAAPALAPVVPVVVSSQPVAAPQTDATANVVAGAESVVLAGPSVPQVPPIASEAERANTLEARKSALPVFLKAADDSIAAAQGELETARTRGASAEDIAALETKLKTMRQVREQVLARNKDISG